MTNPAILEQTAPSNIITTTTNLPDLQDVISIQEEENSSEDSCSEISVYSLSSLAGIYASSLTASLIDPEADSLYNFSDSSINRSTTPPLSPAFSSVDSLNYYEPAFMLLDELSLRDRFFWSFLPIDFGEFPGAQTSLPADSLFGDSELDELDKDDRVLDWVQNLS